MLSVVVLSLLCVWNRGERGKGRKAPIFRVEMETVGNQHLNEIAFGQHGGEVAAPFLLILLKRT